MTKKALILVDIQNDYFPGGSWTLENADAAAENASRVLENARNAGDLIVHVRHENPNPQAPFFVPGTEGAEIHERVSPQGDEAVITKNFPNSFRQTDLKSVLDASGITDVTICGSMSHMCIDATTRAAADHGFAVTLIHDACATRDVAFNGIDVPASATHAAFMAALGSAYAQVTSADEYLG